MNVMEVMGGDLSRIISLANANNKYLPGPVYNIDGYGADPKGLKDSTIPIQTAVNEARTANGVVFIPSGTYKVTSTINAIGVTIVGSGSGISSLYTESDIPLITLDTDTAQSYYSTIKDLGFIGNVTGPRTNNAGILIKGTDAFKNRFNYNSFENLLFRGTYYGIRSTKYTNYPNGENALDWNLFTQIKTANYGANNVAYGFKFDYGSGTGNVFDALNLVTTISGLEWGGSGNENIGDISISDGQFGGSGNAIKATKGATAYSSNITITGCQWDAGLQYGINFTNMNAFRVKACNWGGGVSHVLQGCSGYSIEDSNDTESTYGNYKFGIGIGATVDLFSMTFPSGIYQSLFIEIITFGLMQGIGGRIVTSTYLMDWSGSSAVWTLVNETATGATGSKLSHSAIGGATPKMSVVTVGAVADSSIKSQARVIGDKYAITIL